MKAWNFKGALLCLVSFPGVMFAQTPRIPGHAPTNSASLQGTVKDTQTKLGVPGVRISLVQSGIVIREKLTDGEGIFFAWLN